jgi:hypothetical protein
MTSGEWQCGNTHSIAGRLSLTLFVASIRAHDDHSPLAAHNFAVLANFPHARTDFHGFARPIQFE